MSNNPYNKYKDNPELEEAYKKGWQHGNGFACHNVPKLGDRIDKSADWEGLGNVVTAENIRDYHRLLCYAAESNSRQYSPFESIAHEFNSAGDGGFECDHDDCDCDETEGDTVSSDELWEAFDEGVSDSIMHDLSRYYDSDYGIENCEAE